MLYYFLHSALAADRIKDFLGRNFPAIVRSYRFFYSFFAVVNFFLLAWFHTLVRSDLVFEASDISIGISLFLMWSGAGIIWVALRSYPFSFWFTDPGPSRLVTQGLNAWVRHPLYLGTLLFLLGFFLFSPSFKNLLFVVISILYLIIGSLLEEQKLLKKYGKEYAEYRESVNMLIPFVF
jgi:protein-S-isoprenylcysteine O-methyltransferase Ste14